MSNTKHTPGKIDIHSTGSLDCKYELHPVDDEHGETIIADIHGDVELAKANAERIVRCWNSHDELLEALEKVDRYFGKSWAGKGKMAMRVAGIVAAAIKKATE